MSKARTLAAILIVAAISATSWISYNASAKTSKASFPSETKAPQPRTSTTTLPGHTNDAWKMKPFKLKGLDGKNHSLDEWKGKVIIFNFWASWCAPCQYEIKDLVKIQSEYGNKGLQVVGLGLDEARKLANVKRTLGINYPVLVGDPAINGDLLTEWGNEKQIVPYTVVINKEGKIVYIHRGQLTRETFKDFILPLLS